MKMKRGNMKKLILLAMLFAVVAYAVPPAPYPFTVDSTAMTATGAVSSTKYATFNNLTVTGTVNTLTVTGAVSCTAGTTLNTVTATGVVTFAVSPVLGVIQGNNGTNTAVWATNCPSALNNNQWKYWDDAGQHDWTTGDPLPNGADLSNKQFLQQFRNAIRERWWMAFSTDVVSPDEFSGADISEAAEEATYKTIYHWQTAVISTLCAGFIPVNFGGQTYTYYSESSLYSACGITGLRRTNTAPGDFAYGTIQDGDIIGPWLFEDLQNLFSKLIWLNFFTCANSAWFDGNVTKGMTYYRNGSYSGFPAVGMSAYAGGSNIGALTGGGATSSVDMATIGSAHGASGEFYVSCGNNGVMKIDAGFSNYNYSSFDAQVTLNTTTTSQRCCNCWLSGVQDANSTSANYNATGVWCISSLKTGTDKQGSSEYGFTMAMIPNFTQK